MAKPYSGDLRERVVRAVKAGRTQTEVAGMFRISERSVRRYMGLWRKTGSVLPHTKFGGHKKPILGKHRARVERLVAESSHMTLEAMQARLAADGIKICVGALHNYLKALKYTYKKNAGRRRAEAQGRGRKARSVAKASGKA